MFVDDIEIEIESNVTVTERLTIEPSIETKTYIPTDGKYFESVTVEAVTANIDKNITPDNIKLGVTILGVEGNVAPDKPNQTKTVTPTEEQQIVVADIGYELGECIVEPIPNEYEIPVIYDGPVEVLPSEDTQTLSTQGKKLAEDIEVLPIPSNYEDVTAEVQAQNQIINELEKVLEGQSIGVVDVTNTTATANDVAKGTQFYNANGELTQGDGDLAQKFDYRVINTPPEYPWTQFASSSYASVYVSKGGEVILSKAGTQVGNVYYLNKFTNSWDKIHDEIKRPDFITSINSSDFIIYFDDKQMMIFDDINKRFISLQNPIYGYSPRKIIHSDENYIHVLYGTSLVSFNRATGEYTSKNISIYTSVNNYIQYKNLVFMYYTYAARIDVYDITTNSVFNALSKSTTGQPNITLKYINEADMLYCSYSSNENDTGLYIFDDETQTFVQKLAIGKYYAKYLLTSTGDIYFWSYINTANNFVIKYTKSTNTYSHVCSQDIVDYYTQMFEDSNGTIYMYSTNKNGIYKFNGVDDFELLLGSENLRMYNKYQVENHILFSSNSTSYLGLYAIDINTFNISLLLDTGHESFNYLLTQYGLFFSWKNSNYKNTYIINMNDFTNQIVRTGYYDMMFYEDGNNVFMISGYSSSSSNFGYYDGSSFHGLYIHSNNNVSTPKFIKLLDCICVYGTGNGRIIIADTETLTLKVWSAQTFQDPQLYVENDMIVVRNKFASKLTYYDKNGNFIKYSDKFIYGFESNEYEGKYFNAAGNGYIIGQNGSLAYESGSFTTNSNSKAVLIPGYYDDKFLYFTNSEEGSNE